MTLKDFKKNTLPNTPGVYFFLGKNRKVLYIGRATSLKQRVRSYFDTDIKYKRSVVIDKMVHESKTVEWTETDSVLEAMLLEVNLIRTQRPRYNTKSKDDKSFNHLVITKETYPRILIIRGKEVIELGDRTYKAVYGPFPSGILFKDALKILRKLFQFYDKDAIGEPKEYRRISKMRKGKIDFNRQIGLYPKVQSTKEYTQTIRHVRLFFEGKKKRIIKELERDMKICAKREEFEKAGILKKKIFALKHIQDVALIRDDMRHYIDGKTFRIEAYDIAHMSGKDMVGVMVVCDENLNSRKDAYRKFSIKGYDSSNDTGALTEVLKRRFKHSEWPNPDLIVVDGGVAQKNVALKVLKKFKLTIPIVGVVKDDKHKPKKILGLKKYTNVYKDAILFANSEAHRFAIAYHRSKRRLSLLK